MQIGLCPAGICPCLTDAKKDRLLQVVLGGELAVPRPRSFGGPANRYSRAEPPREWGAGEESSGRMR